MDSMLSGANYTPFLFVIFVGVVLLSLAFYFLLRKLDDLVKTVERERIMVDEKILVIKGLLDQLVGLHTTFRSLLVGPAKAEKEPAWGVEDLLPEDKLAQARARRRSARGGMEDDGPLPSAFFSEDAPAGGRRQPPAPA